MSPSLQPLRRGRGIFRPLAVGWILAAAAGLAALADLRALRLGTAVIGPLVRPRPPDTDEPCDTALPEDTSVEASTAPTVTGAARVAVGPYVGAVTESSAIVWARVDGAFPAAVIWTTDPTFATGLTTTAVQDAVEDSDYTLQWLINGLSPSTLYYYDVVISGGPPSAARARSFRTAPSEGSAATFDFVVLADSNSGSPSLALTTAALENPAFFLQIGDFDHADPRVLGFDIENWRALYRGVLGSTTLGRNVDRSILAQFPLFQTWDDHDYGVNDGDRTLAFRPIAWQAWREYFPTPSLPNPDGGNWYSFRWAQAEFFVLDLRSQRDPWNLCDTSKSMLDGDALASDDQKSWLLASLAASTATWKFIVSSSKWNPTGKTSDSWGNYEDERQEILDFIAAQALTGVVVISGDIHSGGAIDDGTYSGVPEISVPTTNAGLPDCTGGDCGDWSVGLMDPSDPTATAIGYALVNVTQAKGVDLCVLRTKDRMGVTRVELVLTE